MLTILDRPQNSKNLIFNRMVAELSPFMNEFEIDSTVSFLHTIDTSEYDINYSIEDSVTQLRMILGSERYEMIKGQWSVKNQHLIKDGKKKYIRLSDNTVWDGLDPEDNPNDYKVVLM